jgi:predicted HD phosphohydrolase
MTDTPTDGALSVILACSDPHDLGDAIEAAGHDVTHIEVGNRPALEEAGIHEANVYVLTDVEQATSIAVAKDLAAAVKVLVYADESLPDFARRQADLVIDPSLLDPAVVAEEL